MLNRKWVMEEAKKINQGTLLVGGFNMRNSNHLRQTLPNHDPFN